VWRFLSIVELFLRGIKKSLYDFKNSFENDSIQLIASIDSRLQSNINKYLDILCKKRVAISQITSTAIYFKHIYIL